MVSRPRYASQNSVMRSQEASLSLSEQCYEEPGSLLKPLRTVFYVPGGLLKPLKASLLLVSSPPRTQERTHRLVTPAPGTKERSHRLVILLLEPKRGVIASL